MEINEAIKKFGHELNSTDSGIMPNWEYHWLLDQKAIINKGGNIFITTEPVGAVYNGQKIQETIYGGLEKINQEFNRLKDSTRGNITLEISYCPVVYTRCQKEIKDYKEQKYKDSLNGIDEVSLNDLIKTF